MSLEMSNFNKKDVPEGNKNKHSVTLIELT